MYWVLLSQVQQQLQQQPQLEQQQPQLEQQQQQQQPLLQLPAQQDDECELLPAGIGETGPSLQPTSARTVTVSSE